MTAQTKMTPDGTASMAKDGVEMATLRVAQKRLLPKNPFPRTTTADLQKWPRYNGTPKTIEEISSLSDEALREIFAEQERNARS